MPKTKFQELIYGLLMTFFMVLAMELYNAGLINHGLTNAIILHSLPDIFIIFPICFVMGFFFVDRFAPKFASRMVTPEEDKPIFVILARSCVTIAFMCPIMSFWATLIFKSPGLNFCLCGFRLLSAISLWPFSGKSFFADHSSVFCSASFLNSVPLLNLILSVQTKKITRAAFFTVRVVCVSSILVPVLLYRNVLKN